MKKRLSELSKYGDKEADLTAMEQDADKAIEMIKEVDRMRAESALSCTIGPGNLKGLPGPIHFDKHGIYLSVVRWLFFDQLSAKSAFFVVGWLEFYQLTAPDAGNTTGATLRLFYIQFRSSVSPVPRAEICLRGRILPAEDKEETVSALRSGKESQKSVFVRRAVSLLTKDFFSESENFFSLLFLPAV